MPWWAWIALGAFLLTAEMGFVDLEFYLVFLGVSALLVGLVGLSGVELGTTPQWLLFAGLSLVNLVFFRRKVYRWIRRNDEVLPDIAVGETAIALADIAPGETGSAELRGTPWRACNVGGAVIEKGQRARVERTEGVTLHVSKEA